MGYSYAIEVEQDDLTSSDEMADEGDGGGQILDDDTSIEESQSLVDEFEETLRS